MGTKSWIAGALVAAVAIAAGIGLGRTVLAPGGPGGTASPTDPARPQLWTCGMHPQVIQDHPGTCPICGMALTPLRQEMGDGEGEGSRRIAYWWDPTAQPPVIAREPGRGPTGLDLLPVYADEVVAGPAVRVDPAIVQNMGVRVAPVVEGPLEATVRMVGFLRVAEPRERDVALKVGGFVERLFADTEGVLVRAGDPLLEIYSPDLLVAQEELLAAARGRTRLSRDADPTLLAEAEGLLANARRKLALWDIAEADLDAIVAEGRARRTVPIRSPVSGYVTAKMVVPGTAVEPGMRLFRLSDQGVLWLDAQVYEPHWALVTLGQTASAAVRGLPGRTFDGRVVFLAPQVDPMTRSVTARLEFANADLSLKPGMYAAVELRARRAERTLMVPREAVLDSGERQVVFVARDRGHFEPRRVVLGVEADGGRVQILEGLAPGEAVVVSGQFLLDTESRMQEAIRKMLAEGLLVPPAGVAGGEQTAPNEKRGSAMPAGPAAGTGPTTATTPASATAGAPAADPHAGHVMPPPVPAPGAGHPAPSTTPPDVAAVANAYLAIATALAGDRAATAAEVDALVAAAAGLADAGGGPLAREVALASERLRGVDLAGQRRALRRASEAVIRLAEARRPARPLHVFRCEMFPGRWVQTDGEARNPYYGSGMLRCGEREVVLARDAGETR